MVHLGMGKKRPYHVCFLFLGEETTLPQSVKALFHPCYLSCLPVLSPEGGCTVYLGLGGRDVFTVNRAMEAAAKGVKQYQALDVHDFSLDASPFYAALGMDGARAAVLGARLGLYHFQGYASGKEPAPVQVTLDGLPAACEAPVLMAMNLADSILLCRDLVNMPANLLTPAHMAERLCQEAERAGVSAAVLDEAELEALGMKALLAVGKGSMHPPRLLVMRYAGDPDAPLTALVGKGVTCDTGGYCIKSAAGMKGIKGDMAGGAAAAGAVLALAKNRVDCNVVCVVPLCENRISGGSLIPGDVIGSFSGKTIEIINTDAEGRLILADAVSYAIRKENAQRVVDIATLTGAVVHALGSSTAGALSNDPAFWESFDAAARSAGEQYWRFPDYPEYRRMLESKIADIKNLGEKNAGTITAALFIRAFVENKPWIHLDIAGIAWADTPQWEYQCAGATGAGVTSLYMLLEEEGGVQ